MNPRRVFAIGAGYLVLGALAMTGWWLAARPGGRGAAPASPLAAALLSAGEPRLVYPNAPPPAALLGEARADWRSAHLDGWKWRLAQCLDGEPGSTPPILFPAAEVARADGYQRGWNAANAQVEELVRRLGPAAAAAFVAQRAREEPRLYDPARSAPPPAE